MSSNPDRAERVLAAAHRLSGLIENGDCSLDDALDRELAEPELRRTVSDLLLTWFRRRRALECALEQATEQRPRGRLRRLLLLVLTQTHFQHGIAPQSAVNVAVTYLKRRHGDREAAFANAVLRRCAFAPLPEVDLLPPELLRRWRKRYSPGTLRRLEELWLTPAELTVRLCGETPLPPDWEVIAHPWFGPLRFARIPDPAAFWRAPELLTRGAIYVQDPAAGAIAALPDCRGIRRMIELCAAPGGKALCYRELLPKEALLVAADRSARRQELTCDNFARRGLPVVIEVGTPDCWRARYGQFELVTADVPCSNTGVFRRRPDALWRFRESDLAAVTALQREILEEAAALTAPGGQLLYSTCSLEPEENFLQSRAFERRHPEFRPLAELQLLPDRDRDGTYGCLWRRSV